MFSDYEIQTFRILLHNLGRRQYIKCSTERETNVLTREIKMFREGCDVIRFSRIACQIPGEALADDMQF